jgi:hypothetical protein
LELVAQVLEELSPSLVVVYQPSALSPSYYSLFPSCSLSLVLADRSPPCPVDPFPGNFHKELLYHQEYYVYPSLYLTCLDLGPLYREIPCSGVVLVRRLVVHSAALRGPKTWDHSVLSVLEMLAPVVLKTQFDLPDIFSS